MRVLYARRSGPDAADERIVDILTDDPEPSSIRVFTSDRNLRLEAERLGATVDGASVLLARLDKLTG